MTYFVILPRACNLHCEYCREDATFEDPPIDIAYPIDVLKSFLSQDENITIQFYGGEPLLKISLMEEIMDSIPNVSQWSMQTNATFLHKVKSEYLNRMSVILVSIDGREEINDINRGQGNYSKVLDNSRIARDTGFTGDLIARMAVSEVADIYQEVTHLASLKKPTFDHIHWQIDSQWDDDPHARWSDFDKWVDTSYNPGITRLVSWWLDHMKQGKVFGLTPFIPLMKSILYDLPSTIRLFQAS